jgi:hypothetical protein
MVRDLTAERRREVTEDRPLAIEGLAVWSISRVNAAARRILGIRSTTESCADC